MRPADVLDERLPLGRPVVAQCLRRRQRLGPQSRSGREEARGSARSTPGAGAAGLRPSTCRSSGRPTRVRRNGAAAPRRATRSACRPACSTPSAASSAANAAARAPCSGSTASFSRRVSCSRPKQKTSCPVHAPRRRRELEARRGHAAPVHLAVPLRVASPRTGKHFAHEGGQRPRFHAFTIARCADVCGEGTYASETSRRSSAILPMGSPASSPWRTSQQPTTVPVRPIPPQQWTYATAAVLDRRIDVVEDPRHVRDGRRSQVDDRVRDASRVLAEQPVVRLQRVGRVREVDEQRHPVRGERAKPSRGLVRVGRPRVLAGEEAVDDAVAVPDGKKHGHRQRTLRPWTPTPSSSGCSGACSRSSARHRTSTRSP